MPRVPHVPHGEREQADDEPVNARKVLAFRRDAGCPFDDVRKDEYAKARAKGGTIRAASGVAGIDYATGLSWEKHPEMMARIRELRSGAENFVGATTGWIINELKKNVDLARDQNAIKSSNEALMLIYRIINEDKESAMKMARALPHTVGGRELQSRVMEAFGGAPDALPAPRNVNLVDTDGEEA